MPFGIITGTLVVIVAPRVLRKLDPVTATQWYVEQWADLAAEAKASVTRHTDMSAAEVCADLAAARIVSNVPGRVRLRVTHIRGISRLEEEVEQHLSRRPGVKRVVASAATGSVLIFYDRKQHPSLNSLL